jgi:surface protein
MERMFWNAAAFNQPLEQWDVAKVTTMQEMFYGASSFNQPLEKWKVANVTTMQGMFQNASAFHTNAEMFVQPLWTSTKNDDLKRWQKWYSVMSFRAVVIGENKRADREKTDGSVAGVAVGVVAQVLTIPGLAGEIEAFLFVIPPEHVDEEEEEEEDDE